MRDPQPALVKRLIEKKITCFAMERLPRIARAQSAATGLRAVAAA
jgi:NAD(P) transhydrogenase subunit alpha